MGSGTEELNQQPHCYEEVDLEILAGQGITVVYDREPLNCFDSYYWVDCYLSN